MRYIDADKLMEEVKEDINLVELILNQPTVDPTDEHLYLDCKSDCRYYNNGYECVYNEICCRLYNDFYRK